MMDTYEERGAFMANILVRTPEESITLSAQATKRLLEKGNGRGHACALLEHAHCVCAGPVWRC